MGAMRIVGGKTLEIWSGGEGSRGVKSIGRSILATGTAGPCSGVKVTGREALAAGPGGDLLGNLAIAGGTAVGAWTAGEQTGARRERKGGVQRMKPGTGLAREMVGTGTAGEQTGAVGGAQPTEMTGVGRAGMWTSGTQRRVASAAGSPAAVLQIPGVWQELAKPLMCPTPGFWGATTWARTPAPAPATRRPGPATQSTVALGNRRE